MDDSDRSKQDVDVGARIDVDGREAWWRLTRTGDTVMLAIGEAGRPVPTVVSASTTMPLGEFLDRIQAGPGGAVARSLFGG